MFTQEERTLAQHFSQLTWCNPFLPERIEHERTVLGDAFKDRGETWSKLADEIESHPNVRGLHERAEALVSNVRPRLGKAKADERELYEDLALFALFHRHQAELARQVNTPGHKFTQFRQFENDLADLWPDTSPPNAAHLFACFFQLRRAFHHIFECIIGDTAPAAKLRANVWKSIFTHDMRRYQRVLHDRMADLPVLITGPSGTGKELVARGIALATYLPFDPKTLTFPAHGEARFSAVNLAALSPTLIESELFGHRKGAFTGAATEHTGHLETCTAHGCVFLDEIGEAAPEVQVKLLRALESRVFQRVGETEPRSFEGKVIAATNRNLSEEIGAGRFREDLFYRLCADQIQTTPLSDHLTDQPQALGVLTRHFARRILRDAEEAECFAAEATEIIARDLPADYAWPGNFRELEQCLRNILVRGTYRPADQPSSDVRQRIAREVVDTTLDAEQLLSRYCTLVYAKTDNWQEAARRLGLDHRTVKAKVDNALLDELRKA